MVRIIAVITLLLISPLSYSRLTTIDEASFTSHSDVSIKINQDGSMVEHVRLTYFLKKPQSTQLGTFPINYSPSYETLELKKAYVLTRGKTYEPQKVEDKPIASTVLEGFDAKNRLVVNFSHVEVGSTIYIEYITKHKTLIENFASFSFSAWNFFPVLKGTKFVVESERKLFSHVKSFNTDLAKNIEFKEEGFDKNKKVYRYSIVAKKDLYYDITDESHSYEEESLPYVAFATTDSYLEMIRPQAKKFLEKLYQPLPESFKTFVLPEDKNKDLIGKVESIMARMMDRLRYSGDWRTVEGSFAPRDKAAVATTGYGDCKDFSVLLASLLRQEGYEAYPALVFRSREYQVDLETQLPSMQSFNHVITYVKHNGKSYWFDPTNYLSFAKRPLEDISNRKALVLSPKIFLEKIPQIKPEENVIELREEIKFFDNKKRHVTVDRFYIGLAAFDLHMKFFKKSKQEGEDILLRSTAGDFELLAKHRLDFPQNLTRIVSDKLQTKSELTFYNPLIKTTAGYGVSVPTDRLVNFMKTFDPKKYEFSGLKLSDVYQRKVYSTLKGKKLKSDEKIIKSEIFSPWFDYKRIIEQKSDDIVITHEITVKKEVIKHEELSSPELIKLREDLRSKVDDIILVFE